MRDRRRRWVYQRPAHPYRALLGTLFALANMALDSPLKGDFTLPSMKNSEAPIRVELLYFDGCPSYERVRSDVTEVIAEMDLDARVKLGRVATQAQADALRFAGSPTVKMNGRDLEDYDGPGVLACRLYGEKSWPSRALLRLRLLAAVSGSLAVQPKTHGGDKR